MNKSKKFVIAIEETVVQEFKIIADTTEKTMEIAEKQYKDGNLLLSPGEVQFKQMAIVKPENEATDWCEF